MRCNESRVTGEQVAPPATAHRGHRGLVVGLGSDRDGQVVGLGSGPVGVRGGLVASDVVDALWS